MIQAVSDSRSNADEQIARAAQVVGRSPQARAVFTAIYTGKRKIKTVADLAKATKLTAKQVVTHGKKFADSQVVHQIRHEKKTAYQKDDFYHRHKPQILRLAGNKKKLAEFPTKRNPSGSRQSITSTVQQRANVPVPKPITVDEIGSFSLVKKIKPSGNLPTTISEKHFKLGVRNILGETGPFTDWGGERNDLFSTRMMLGGKRVGVAFGFKGPGTKGELVPGKLGKNGDQIQRLFETDADVFFIQYWREINESVLIQMQHMAISKATWTKRKIRYGIIDGQDSNRLLMAYPRHFAAAGKSAAKKRKRSAKSGSLGRSRAAKRAA